MSVKTLLAKAEASSLKSEDDQLEFEIGDTVDVHYKIQEGDKEQTRVFSGIVIARRGRGPNTTFTVRKIVEGQGVERIFPLHSPKIVSVEVKKRAKVRRAKLFFLRDRVGKMAYTLKERPITRSSTGRKRTRVKARKAKQAEAASTEAAAPKAKKSRKKSERTKKADS